MNRRRGFAVRSVLFAVLAVLIPVGLVACGSSDDESTETQSLAYTADADGKVTGPTTAESGLVEISFQNDGKKESDLQLVRTEGDETIEDAVEGANQAVKGAALPDWFLLAGGVGATAAGESGSVTQELEPGTYFAFGTAEDPAVENALTIEVTGEATDEGLEADAEVNAFEYSFETDGLTTGENEVLFANTGAQPHHIVYGEIKGDATLEDLKAAFKEEKGPPPIEEKTIKSTTVLEGGTDQLVTLDFAKAGRYALICFISDREGGPPHVAKGMIAEVDIE